MVIFYSYVNVYQRVVRHQKCGYESKMEAEDHMRWSFALSENRALINSMLDHHFPHWNCHIPQTHIYIYIYIYIYIHTYIYIYIYALIVGYIPCTSTWNSWFHPSLQWLSWWPSGLSARWTSEGGKSSAKPTSITTASGGSMEHSLRLSGMPRGMPRAQSIPSHQGASLGTSRDAHLAKTIQSPECPFYPWGLSVVLVICGQYDIGFAVGSYVYIYIYIHLKYPTIALEFASWRWLCWTDHCSIIYCYSHEIRNSLTSGKENLLPMKQRPQWNQLKTEFQCKVWCVHTAGMCPKLYVGPSHLTDEQCLIIFNQGGSFIHSIHISISSPRPNEIQWHDILQFQIFVHDAFGVAIRDTCSVAVLKTVQRNGQKPRHLACTRTPKPPHRFEIKNQSWTCPKLLEPQKKTSVWRFSVSNETWKQLSQKAPTERLEIHDLRRLGGRPRRPNLAWRRDPRLGKILDRTKHRQIQGDLRTFSWLEQWRQSSHAPNKLVISSHIVQLRKRAPFW